MNEAEAFLAGLFGHPSLAGLWFGLWLKKDPIRRSQYYPCAVGSAIMQAASDAIDLAPEMDVYVGCCPYTEKGPENGRGSADKAGALVALWADIDVAGPGHAATNLPESKEAARDLLWRTAHPGPSAIVDSGGGLHAWWLLREPIVFRNAADRAKGAALSTAWGARVTEWGRSHGWAIDKVSDLARVLRVPGTLNHKRAGEPPRPVELENVEGAAHGGVCALF